MNLEWVQVEEGLVVVATDERAWLHRPNSLDASDPFRPPMRSRGSFATTRNLLDGSISAAQKSVAKAGSAPALTLARWMWRLAGYYHTTRATPVLMNEAAERFAASGRTLLADYAARKALDEKRHDELAARDLKALGCHAELLNERLIPPTARRLVDYFTRSVRAADPVGCIGYAYALERLAVAVNLDYIGRVKGLLPPGVRATRCLRVHSALGSDARHLNEAVEVIASLTAAERTLVARACYETTRLCCSPPVEGYLPDEEIMWRFSTLTAVTSKKGAESCQSVNLR